MDDDMEDEIVYELVTAHIHIIWRYLGVTSAGLVELIMPGPGETFKTKMFQPGPFMFLMFLVLVASVALQSSSHLIRHWLIKAPYILGLNSVADSTFKRISVGLDLASSSENVTWEFNEGIAAVYGMQGRRGNMEDRFSILQDVDVGGKKMSFFGVFDGHGGQFTAEYVKENLFRNTIEKIRQLRSQLGNGKSSKTSGTSVNRKNSKAGSNNNNNNNNNITVKRNNSNKASEKKTNEENKIEKSEKDPQTSDSSSDDNIEAKKNEKNTPTKTPSKETPKDKEPKKDSTPTPKKDSASETEKEATTKVPTGSCVETLSSKPSEEDTCSNDVSHKKDDTYTNLGFLKRNSFSKCSAGSGNGEVPSVGTPSGDSQEYMDSYGNLNYTRLLTDQILAVDRKVVHLCKSHSDMSGTTAVVGVLEGELLVIANVGDSRAVMGDTRGSAVALSFDHKPNQLKERRRIKEAGGFISFTGVWRVAGVLATSRALGDFPLKEPRPLITAEPDVLTFSLRDHKAQFVILATDGLWDVVSNEEAVSFIAARLSQRDHGAASLAHHAYVLGSQDNITIAVLVLGHLAG